MNRPRRSRPSPNKSQKPSPHSGPARDSQNQPPSKSGFKPHSKPKPHRGSQSRPFLKSDSKPAHLPHRGPQPPPLPKSTKAHPAPHRGAQPPPLPKQGHKPHSASHRGAQPPPHQKSGHKPRPPSAPARDIQPLGALHWREALIPFLTDPNYQPLDQPSLARKLRVSPEETEAFAKFLSDEEKVGRIMQVRQSLYVLPRRLGFSVGVLQMNERGFGFLVPSNPVEPDFYVSAEDTGTAFHGDLVLARLKEQRGGRQRDSRLRGEVVKVLQRKRRQLVGTLRKTPMFYYVLPDESRIPHDICVPPPTDSATIGQKVVVELKDWPDRRKPPEGIITEVLGAPDAPGVDLLSIIRKHDLPTSFPENVEQEAADIQALIPPEEIARREDFRKIFTLTIDPDDAKDFDDALSYQAHSNGDFEIFIHIADVSHYVQPGSTLDVEARSRGNSIYLVDRVIPMLPEKLSNGICSLQPHVDRLVKTAIVMLDRNGEIKSFRFAAGIIHSAKRFTYKEAFAQLSKPATTPIANHLHALNHMAQILRKRRFAKGALDLDFPEVKVRVNELGIPTHLERNENDISHQLIEEFMLLANEVVALELKRHGRPGLYRIHENPDPGRLEEFRAQAKSMGYSCGDLTQRGEIQKLLNKVRGQPGESVVKIGLLKSLKRAMYSPKPLGHYGLAKLNYTHFTSPIRRYSDFVVHRILFGDRQGAVEFTYDKLAQLSLHLSNTERSAAEAEQESVKLKKLEYFDRQAHATKRTSFQALIQEVRSSGLLVQLPEFVVQGMVPLSSLEGDLFVFNPQRLELQGQRTKLVLRAGLSLQVEVLKVDLGRQQVDFRATKQSLLKLLSSTRV